MIGYWKIPSDDTLMRWGDYLHKAQVEESVCVYFSFFWFVYSQFVAICSPGPTQYIYFMCLFVLKLPLNTNKTNKHISCCTKDRRMDGPELENCMGINVEPNPCPSPSLPNPFTPRTRNLQAHPRPYLSVSNPSLPVLVIYNPPLPHNWNSVIHVKGVKTNGLVHQN